MTNFEGLTDDQFDWLAEKKDWRCDRCDQVITREEESTYYLTGYCGYCNHVRENIMTE